MGSRFSPFSLLRALLGVVCAASTFRVGNAQIVTEFDTSTGGFEIRCDPVSPPALCAFDAEPGQYAMISYTTSGEGIPDDKPTDTGIMQFATNADYIRAENCTEENCSFVCDDVCSCATGTIQGGFTPDGGSCKVLSSNPGTVPTAQPTQMPTSPPTFDLATSISYNATMTAPSVLRVRCDGNWPILDSYCALVSGETRLHIVDDDTYGWSNCDQKRGDCVVSCSPDCTCEVAMRADDGGFDETAPTTPCEVIEPTPAPTSMPTITPTSGSAGSHEMSVWTFAGLAIAYVVGWMV